MLGVRVPPKSLTKYDEFGGTTMIAPDSAVGRYTCENAHTIIPLTVI